MRSARSSRFTDNSCTGFFERIDVRVEEISLILHDEYVKQETNRSCFRFNHVRELEVEQLSPTTRLIQAVAPERSAKMETGARMTRREELRVCCHSRYLIQCIFSSI